MAEWVAEAIPPRPGNRVLDPGCGRDTSSVFLARQFSVQVSAAGLWLDPTERLAWFTDAGVTDRVFPIRVDSRALPFAADCFDAVVSIDSYPDCDTDDLDTGYLARFAKPGGTVGVAGLSANSTARCPSTGAPSGSPAGPACTRRRGGGATGTGREGSPSTSPTTSPTDDGTGRAGSRPSIRTTTPRSPRSRSTRADSSATCARSPDAPSYPPKNPSPRSR
jgi:hypothetical protein